MVLFVKPRSRRFVGDEVHDAAERVRAVERRAGSLHHLDALDAGQAQLLEVQVAVRVLAEVAPAVDEDEHALVRDPVDRDVALAAARVHLDAGAVLLDEDVLRGAGAGVLDLGLLDESDRLRHVEQQLLAPVRGLDSQGGAELRQPHHELERLRLALGQGDGRLCRVGEAGERRPHLVPSCGQGGEAGDALVVGDDALAGARRGVGGAHRRARNDTVVVADGDGERAVGGAGDRGRRARPGRARWGTRRRGRSA